MFCRVRLYFKTLQNIIEFSVKLRTLGEITIALKVLDIIEDTISKKSPAHIQTSHATQKIYCLWRLFDNYSALHLSILTLEHLEKTKNENE